MHFGFLKFDLFRRGWHLGLVFLVTYMLCMQHSRAQQAKIWEFDPYRVDVWYSFSPTVNLSPTGKEVFLSKVQQELQRTYRATWKSQFRELPSSWLSIVDRQFDEFALADLTLNEFTLVASLKNVETRSVRTMEAVADKVAEIAVDEVTLRQLEASAAQAAIVEDSLAARILSKCVVDPAGQDSIVAKLADATVPVAILPKNALEPVKETARTMITPFPWQTDSILRVKDKILFLMIDGQDGNYHFRVRELDCPMQYLGEAFESETRFWPHASHVVSDTIIKAFAPIARVESAEPLTAELRLKAGGLILDKENPARVGVGDVMQPIVRRDDRNGMPTLLQPLSFTYAAITATDEVTLQSNVYTYSGGPGLQGRKNRRTRRILLRVRPKTESTAVKLVVRGNTDEILSGSFIYARDMLTGKYDLLGRTDWRGQFTLDVPEENGSFLAEEVRKARIVALREAKNAALDEEAKIEIERKAAEERGETPDQNPPTPAADALAKLENYDPDQDEEALPLRVPLRMLYVKNGDQTVAKLPLVPGLTEVSVAELLDDRRRLQAEAFVRGFQEEILDLIGIRNLYAAQIQLHLKNDQKEEAEKKLEEMARLDDYNIMADKMERLQRAMLSEEEGPIPLSAKRSIDRMFGTTRTMLQKYLQDNLYLESEKAVLGL